MKKRIIFILLILILPSVLAVETTLKQEYQPGETLIIEITGNFLDNIEPEDILFYSGRLYTPMIYDLTKIQDKYYLYSILPNKQRNYTLIIKNAHYLEVGQEKTEDLEFDFNVKGNISSFNINPGFIITDKDFNIKINSIKSLSIATDFLSESSQIEISEGTKTLSFSVSDITKSELTILTLTSDSTEYKIPVYVFTSETSEITLKNNLRFSKNNFNFTIFENEDFTFPVTLINTGQDNISDITLTTNLDIIKITPQNISVLESGKSIEVIISINSNKEEITKGKITASSENLYSEISLTITTTTSKEEFQEFVEETEILEQDSCSDLQGDFCDFDEGEECSGTSSLTIDGLCCIGTCEKPDTEGGMGKTIAIIVIIIIIAIIIFFVFKKLKARKTSHKQIINDKTKKYEERFKKPVEVRGNLTRT
tara:strand:+ start:976 stop:2253 length:1278 start_codon:yes stop_codon:yes gene_type:complete